MSDTPPPENSAAATNGQTPPSGEEQPTVKMTSPDLQGVASFPPPVGQPSSGFGPPAVAPPPAAAPPPAWGPPPVAAPPPAFTQPAAAPPANSFQAPPPGYTGPLPTGGYAQQQAPPPAAHPPAAPPQVAYLQQAPPPMPPMPPMPPAAMPTGGQPPAPKGRLPLIAAALAVAVLVIGAGVAVILAVSGSDKGASPVAAKTGAAVDAAANQSRTVTIIQQTKTVQAPAPKPHRTPHKRVPVTASPSASSNPAQGLLERQAIKSMLQRHFSSILNGNYSSAYNDLTGSLKGTSEASWVSSIRDDGLYNFNLDVSPQVTAGSNSGTAVVNTFHTEASASGCKDWSGSWGVTKISGQWYISSSNLSQTRVSCGG